MKSTQLRDYILGILIPFVIVGTLHLNNARYYDLKLGYDMPQHLNNTLTLMQTGQMPPPPLTSRTYEAHQAPIFYELSALILHIANIVVEGDSFTQVMPIILWVLGMLWVVLVAVFVIRSFRQILLPLRILMICVILLFPSNTIMSVMYTNDLPVTIFGSLSIWLLWLMCRTNRLTSKKLWFWSAIWAGLAMLFKLSGIIIVGTYSALAIYIVLSLLWHKHFTKARQVIVAASIGLPLMMTPWIINTRHATRYIDNIVGATTESRYLWDAVTPSFFLSFDSDFFSMPFAYQSGSQSYWSLQFLTLHNDYYNHWNSITYKNYPAHQLVTVPHRDPMPFTRLTDAITLQYLALPITLIMVFGVGVSIYRIIIHNRFALRDGSVLVIIYIGVAQAAQFIRFAASPDIRAVLIHARYLGFIYSLAFLVGGWWLLRLTRQSKHARGIRLTFATLMFAYCFIAFRLMWLPPI